GPRLLRPDVERPLRLELEEWHVPVRPDPLQLRLQGAVAVPGDVLHVLEELAGLDPGEELVRGQEPVLPPVLLPGPTAASRRRDRHLERRDALDELPDERSLAGARRHRADDG